MGSWIRMLVAAAVIAAPALAITPADLAGTWQVEGVDSNGTRYQGQVTFTTSGSMLQAAGTVGGIAFTGIAFVDPDVVWMLEYVGTPPALRHHEIRFDPSTGTFRSQWFQFAGFLSGTETLSRRAPLDVNVGGSPRTIELARKIASGRYTRAEALEFLDANYADSQDYIKKNIRRTVQPNYYKGHTQPMVGIVEHYTTNPFMDPTLRYFTSDQTRKASSHFVIDADGRVIQVFKHTNRTWHAGTAANHTHFGIENSNTGYLRKRGSKFYDYYDREYKRSLPLFGTDPVDFGRNVWGYRYWMPWPHAQVVSNIIVSRALAAVYPIRRDKVVMHKDVAPSRRTDPGPAFPMKLYADEIFTNRDLGSAPWLEEYRTDPDFMVKFWQN